MNFNLGARMAETSRESGAWSPKEVLPAQDSEFTTQFGARLALSKKAVALLAAVGIGIVGTATYFVLPKNKETKRPAVVAIDENRAEFMVAQLAETVMTYDEIDQHIDTLPKESRPGLGFILRRVRGKWEFAISLQAKEQRANLTNVTGFTVFNGDIYVRHLDEERGMAPSYGYVSVKEGGVEVEEKNLPPEVRRELGVMKYSQMDRYIDTPHMFPTHRPGLSFRLDTERQDGVLHIHFGEVGRFKLEEAAKSTTFDNVAGFTVFGGDVYVKSLNPKNNYLPQYFRVTKNKDVKETPKEELPTRVKWDFGLLHIKNPPGIIAPEIKQLGLKSAELKQAVVRQDIVTPALGENNDSETVLKETARFIAGKFPKHHSYVAAKLNGSETIVVALEPDQGDQNYYQNFRLFVGRPGTSKEGFLQELEIHDVERFRDGGTTIIKAGENVFHIERFTWQPTLNSKRIDVFIKGDGARLAEDFQYKGSGPGNTILNSELDARLLAARLARRATPPPKRGGVEARPTTNTTAARMATEYIQTYYQVGGLLPSRETSEIDAPLGARLALVVAHQPAGALLPIGVLGITTPASFALISVGGVGNGSIQFRVGRGPNQGLTRGDIQQAAARLASAVEKSVEADEVERVTAGAFRLIQNAKESASYENHLAIDLRLVTRDKMTSDEQAWYIRLTQHVQEIAGGEVSIQFGTGASDFKKIQEHRPVYLGALSADLLKMAGGAGLSATPKETSMGQEQASTFVARIVLSILVQRLKGPTSQLENLWNNLRTNPLIELKPDTFQLLKNVLPDARIEQYLPLTVKIVRLDWKGILQAISAARLAVGAAA